MSERRAWADFRAARWRAFLRDVQAALSGRSNELLAWEQVRDQLSLGGQVYRGVQAVPLAQVVGSVSRYHDFDRAFLPTQDHTAGRWRSISRAFYDEVSLPPIKLFQIGAAYFVVDGNHRVSVARERGQEFIDAEVIEVDTRVPVSADLDARAVEIKGEYADFLKRTRLDELRPAQRIELTIAGGYRQLLEHIAVHRHFMGLEQQRFVAEEEAVCDWYDHVYTPLVQIVRDNRILKEFPARTEADLYLWIVEHQHYLRQEAGPQVQTEEAARHFADRYSRRLVRQLARVARRLRPGGRDERSLTD